MSLTPQIETARLKLVAANEAMARMELGDRGRLFEMLGVAVQSDWPPPLNDDESYDYFLRFIVKNPDQLGWGYWYVIRKDPEQDELVGNCGFMGMPDENGVIETGYSIIASRQRQGYASEAVGGLIGWARQRGARTIIARTYAEQTASIGVMRKNGLIFAGEGEPEEGKPTVKYLMVL